MKKRKMLVSFMLILLIVIASAIVGFAEEKIDFRQTRLARVAYVEGGASVERQATQELDQAELNVPVFTGDLVYTNPNTRMELELYGGFVRLGENTSLELVKFTPKVYRFDLSVGLATFSFGEESPEIEVATPQAAISIKEPGIYRVKVNLDGTTEVIVQQGQAELFARTSNFKLHKDKRAILSTTNNLAVSNYDFKDEWDRWNNEREHLISAHSINSHIKPKPYLYGNSNLNQHGRWINVGGFGFVWKPSNLSANWAPYRIGRWAFYRTSGWTWISQEAWGWLPYHYGYWIYLSDQGWVWVPEDLDWYWSPALVTWYTARWDNTNYACWHPRTDYWPNGGGSNGNGYGNGNNGNNNGNNFTYLMKDKFPVNVLEAVKSKCEVISAIPVEALATGKASPKDFNHMEVEVGRVNSGREILEPTTQGINTSSSNGKNFKEVNSRPLVTKLGAGEENSRRKYDLPKGVTVTSTTIGSNSEVSNASNSGKKVGKNLEKEPTVKGGAVNEGSISQSNNNTSGNNSNSNTSNTSSGSTSRGKESMSEKVRNEPKVSNQPVISAPVIQSSPPPSNPSNRGETRGGSGGGNKGKSKND